VIILRGNQKGKKGKITQCSRRNLFIFVENVIGVKTSNMNYFIQIHPSNVLIDKINLTDTRKEKLSVGNKTISGEFDNNILNDLNVLE
jgi:ribosomal protein uL24